MIREQCWEGSLEGMCQGKVTLDIEERTGLDWDQWVVALGLTPALWLTSYRSLQAVLLTPSLKELQSSPSLHLQSSVLVCAEVPQFWVGWEVSITLLEIRNRICSDRAVTSFLPTSVTSRVLCHFGFNLYCLSYC